MDDDSPSIRALKPFTRRFITAAIFQGTVIVVLTIILIIGQATVLKPEVSRVIAAGGAGTWFTFGFIVYINVGVVGMAASALFYHLFGSRNPNRAYSFFSWTHLLLMNVGVTVAAGLMMYAGYLGGAAALPTTVGGRGLTAQEVHLLIAEFVTPIAVGVIVLCIGAVMGGIRFLLAFRGHQ